MLTANASPSGRQRGDHVGGEDALGRALPARRLPAGLGVQRHARCRGGERIEPGGEQRGDHPSQHITCSGGCQRGSSARVDGHPTGGLGDQRVIALQHDDRLRLLGRRAYVAQTLAFDLLAAHLQQPAQLARMRGQHGWRGSRCQLAQASRVRVQPVGVEHQRDLRPVRELAGELDGAARFAPARGPAPAHRHAGSLRARPAPRRPSARRLRRADPSSSAPVVRRSRGSPAGTRVRRPSHTRPRRASPPAAAIRGAPGQPARAARRAARGR